MPDVTHGAVSLGEVAAPASTKRIEPKKATPISLKEMPAMRE
jgi:hypothetical protein